MRYKEKGDRRKILILGGARSGKSRYAQELAMSLSNEVIFIATGEPLDKEMKARIREHVKHRPASWQTVELPRKIGQNLETFKNANVILIDCITLFIANIIGEGKGLELCKKEMHREIDELINAMNSSNAHFILVSNEVGLGIVPDNKLARIYRDLLGEANQLIAKSCDEVYFMTAGISQNIK